MKGNISEKFNNSRLNLRSFINSLLAYIPGAYYTYMAADCIPMDLAQVGGIYSWIFRQSNASNRGIQI